MPKLNLGEWLLLGLVVAGGSFVVALYIWARFWAWYDPDQFNKRAMSRYTKRERQKRGEDSINYQIGSLLMALGLVGGLAGALFINPLVKEDGLFGNLPVEPFINPSMCGLIGVFVFLVGWFVRRRSN